MILLLLLVQTYRLPFEEGKGYILTQGNNGTTSHSGNIAYAFDFGMAEGTKVCAARGGKVVFAKEDETKGTGAGNHVKIDHGDGTVAVYMHLKKDGALVEVGETVEQGDVLGLSGATGRVTGPHLHFQVEKGGATIPVRFEEADGPLVEGRSYVSQNASGVPAAVKDLERQARLAFALGHYGAAHARYAKLAKTKFPPAERARARLDEIAALAGEVLRSDDPARLALARLQFKGTPSARKIEERAGKAAPGKSDEHFYKAVQYELDGFLALALKHYREAKEHPQAKARIAVVEEKLKEAAKR